MPDAPLSLEFGRLAVDRPECTSTGCYRSLRADAAGLFAAEFEPQAGIGGWPGGIAYLFSIHPDYESNVQVLRDGSGAITLNLRLRDIRTVAAGENATVEIDAESTRCTDLEGIWAAGRRCEVVRIVADRTGCLLVSARSRTPGGDAPELIPATSGNYASAVCATVPGARSISVGKGTFAIFVAMPEDLPPQRVDVVTLLQ